MSSTGNNRNNWREPSAQHCQKYGLRPLPDDFEPTEEEELLLEGYDYVRQYERIAQRLKTEAAMKKLAEKDAAFQEAKTNKRRRKKKKSRLEKDTGAGAIDNNNNNAASDEDEADEYSESDDSEREEDLHRRREEKLQAMRDEVQQAKQAERKEEELIAEHLAQGEQEDDTTAPTILKRRLPNESAAPSKSLISNITSAATPPHDFSKSLELTPARGKTLFPTEPDQIKWSPPEGVFSPLDGAFCVELDNFDANNLSAPTSNNTLAIKFMAPADAQRFSLNIASAADRTEFESILFHFNPRQFERGGQLVVNDKNDGIWGQALAIPLSQVPLLFGQTACTLIIQVHGDGFDIFLEGQHCARLEHRQELPTGQNLVLQFPSTDDYGAPENWVVYKVWWGHRPLMTKGDVSGVPGVNQFNAMHPRKLFVSGLSKIFTESDVDHRRAELERAFGKYGGSRGVVQVIVPTNSTYAFVEMETEQLSEQALQEMAGTYRLNRARRSRHEALQEERAKKEQGKESVATATTKDW